MSQWFFYCDHPLTQHFFNCNKKLMKLLCQMTYFYCYCYVSAFVENDLILQVSTAPNTLSRRISDEFPISRNFGPKGIDKAKLL